jgi:hypothetical protein
MAIDKCGKKRCGNVHRYIFQDGTKVCMDHKHEWLMVERMFSALSAVEWNIVHTGKTKKK